MFVCIGKNTGQNANLEMTMIKTDVPCVCVVIKNTNNRVTEPSQFLYNCSCTHVFTSANEYVLLILRGISSAQYGLFILIPNTLAELSPAMDRVAEPFNYINSVNNNIRE